VCTGEPRPVTTWTDEAIDVTSNEIRAPGESGSGPSSSAGRGDGRSEVALALANGVKLGASLMSTLVVAFAVRFWLPRFLGPEDFGRLHWAEAFAAAAFVFVNLGVDMYIRREVSIRPAHAGDFYGGVVVLRLFASVALLGAMFLMMRSMGKDHIEMRLAYLFAIGQLAVVFTNTQGTLLNAVGHVNELAILNVLAKIFWGAAIFAGLTAGFGLEVVAVAFAISESGKAILYHRILKRRMHIDFRVDLRAAWTVIVVSLPYFLNLLCHSVYERVGVNLISVMSTDAEVGWYGAAANLASMAFLFMPIVSLVLMPMGMRLGEQSAELMNESMRGALRIVVVVCALGSSLLYVHAHDIVALLFGEAFGPSARTLQVLSPMLPITYVAVVASLQVNMQGRIWTLVKVSVAGLLVNPVTNLLLIAPLSLRLGPGGAGVAAAIAALATELTVAGLMLWALGRAALDGRTLAVFAKTVGLCAVVVALHAVLPNPGLWWVPVEVAVYVGLGVVVGAFPLARMAALVKDALARRRARKGA
jgi:O-antigen/teichoic acid export membrane protein